MKDVDQPSVGSTDPPSTVPLEHLEPTGHNPLLVQPPKKPAIAAVPDSALLKRLHDFLPQLAAANASLPSGATTPSKDPYLPSLHPREEDDASEPTLRLSNQEPGVALQDDHESDSESNSGSEEGVRVEMDLACGVFELHSASATEAAARATGGVGTLEQQGVVGGDADTAMRSPEQLLRVVQGRVAADLREVPANFNEETR